MSNYWAGRVCMVVGASQGLGRALAEALALKGAHLALVARDAQRLKTAEKVLPTASGSVLTIARDVTSADEAAEAVQQTVDRFGQLDAVMHCVGRSMRGAVLDVPDAQWDSLWKTNVLSAVHVARASIERLAARRGHFVAVGSLSSKTASPHLGAYPVTKSALAMFCHQLRLEWSDAGLHVLLVCPGPIARDDAGRRYADQASDLPAAAQQPGGGVRLRAVDPNQLAMQILDACQRRKAELVVPSKARWLFAIQQLSPRMGDWILRRKSRS